MELFDFMYYQFNFIYLLISIYLLLCRGGHVQTTDQISGVGFLFYFVEAGLSLLLPLCTPGELVCKLLSDSLLSVPQFTEEIP